ncbi:MAG: Hsp70 family protein [Proteobacteria bacterium]|nr:Hsp70 family protein [Pseudomonadota bacterium]
MMTNNIILGIDLGTTFSAMAYVDDEGRARVIPNAEGQNTTPSVVLIENGKVVVGELAMNQAATKSDHVVRWIKRAMGEPDYRFQGMTPAEISAEILKKLKRDAEHAFGQSVTSAVITCPAYFSSPEVEATKLAGELAEFEVREIVKEPTAAAVYYGVDHLSDGQKLLVYDLGGGTLDVTILLLEKGIFRPVATAGDRRLGGHDWTTDLLNRVCRELTERYGEDPRVSILVEHRLYEECERAKRDLSRVKETIIPCVYNGRAEEVRVTRDEFEEITDWRIRETIRWTEKVLSKPAIPMTWVDIDGILLVGGATRMPRVREALKETSGKEPIVTGEADTMVALGAAILGKGEVLPRNEKSALVATGEGRGIIAVKFDRTASRTLGTKVMVWKEGKPEIRNSSIIAYGTLLPAKVTRDDYQISVEGQRIFDVPVVEFDDIGPEVIIGTYRFICLPQTRAGTPISVTFSYDGSGIADVTAIDQRSKRALSRSQINYEPPDLAQVKSARKERVVVFALDVSGSMSGDKIMRAKEALISSAKSLSEASQGTVRIGVVTFGSEARCVCEPTLAVADICRKVKDIGTSGTTAMDKGIATAVSLIKNIPVSAVREIALVTDGIPDDREAALAAARAADSDRIGLCIVGIGKDDVDEDFLREITTRALTVEGANELGDALMTLLTETSDRTGCPNLITWGGQE